MTPPDHDQPLDDGPLDDDTLAVNAVVDDEATPEQRRRVARDPDLVGRVAALREAAAAVAAPPELPGPDVLAALRQRALDAATEPDQAPAEPPAVDDDVDLEVRPPAPVGDLGAARARRSRSLPPLPAVAAVVVLLVVVGVGFLVAGRAGDDDQDTAATSAESAGDSGSGGGSDGGEGDAGAAEGSSSDELQDQFGAETTTAPPDDPAASQDGAGTERPSDVTVEELRRRATASYATPDDLLAELGRTDPDALALEGSATGTATTTTRAEAPEDTEASGQMTAELAADPVARRCDDTLRAGEPDLDEATGAALVEVDGVPVLVLRTPIASSEQAPLGIRLTALTALDCSPLGAVVR